MGFFGSFDNHFIHLIFNCKNSLSKSFINIFVKEDKPQSKNKHWMKTLIIDFETLILEIFTDFHIRLNQKYTPQWRIHNRCMAC